PLVRALAGRGFRRSEWDDIRMLGIPVASALRDLGDPAWVRAVSALSAAAIQEGDLEFMFGPVTDALDQAQRTGDALSAVECLSGLSFFDQTGGRWRELTDTATAANLDVFRVTGSAGYHGSVVDLVDGDAAFRGLLAEARTFPIVLPGFLGCWSTVLFSRGDFDTLDAVYAEAMAGISRWNITSTIMLWWLATAAVAALHRGDGTRLDELLDQADSRA